MPKTIVAFGASTTAYRGELKVYSMHLAEHFPEYNVINSGVPGNSTELAKERFERDVLAHKPQITIIQLGINDSMIDVWKNPPANKPRIPIETYEKNMRYFIDKLEKIGCRTILMGPQPLIWTDKLIPLYGKPPYDTNTRDGFNFMLAKYTDVLRKISAEKSIPFIDVTAAFDKYIEKNKIDINELFLDGMHPNDDGQKIIAGLLIKELEKTEKDGK